MSEHRIPDLTLMNRLELSVKGMDWAASLVAHKQHERPGGEWSAHQHLFHLLLVERDIYQPRIAAMLTSDRPEFQRWDPDGTRLAGLYETGTDLMGLAAQFMRERERTVEILRGLTLDQWQRTGVMPSHNEVDVAWLAGQVLVHGLEHFGALLGIHQEVEHFHARQWAAAE